VQGDNPQIKDLENEVRLAEAVERQVCARARPISDSAHCTLRSLAPTTLRFPRAAVPHPCRVVVAQEFLRLGVETPDSPILRFLVQVPCVRVCVCVCGGLSPRLPPSPGRVATRALPRCAAS
jgi:hypothetical protein